jgi:AcrR family transcriptional regulator
LTGSVIDAIFPNSLQAFIPNIKTDQELRMNKQTVLSKLKEQEKLARRTIIIDAAEKEFAEKPFQKVTMRDIAKRAGISPALIYRHFPDQQSLFAEAFMRGIGKVFEKIFVTIDESPDGAIEQVISDFIEYFTFNDQYFQMMMNFLLGGPIDPELFDKLTKIEREILGHFDIIFRKMNADGDIRNHSHTLFAALIGIVATFRNHPEKNTQQVLTHRQKIARNLSKLMRNV